MNNQTYRRLSISVCVLATFLTAGCTHMIRPPKQPFTAYVGQDKIHLKVGVNVTDELRKAKSEYHSMGDVWVIPIGDSIATNACVLAQHTFDDEVGMVNGQLPPNETVAAILTPRVAYINRTVGATSFGESIVDIKVEWTLSDSKGNIIWVNTINGQSSGSTGWTSPEKILKRALEDLLTKSQQAIASAPAIREFASKPST